MLRKRTLMPDSERHVRLIRCLSGARYALRERSAAWFHRSVAGT